jgi:hypothetical protein
VIVIVALAIGISGGGGPDSHQNPTTGALPAITEAAPPHGPAQAAACALVLGALPVALDGLDQRRVVTTPDSPYVVAWGQPAIVLSCGVDRPKDLVANSSAQYFDGGNVAGPYYDITSTGDANVYTSVDRGPYISITIPGKYQADKPLTELSTVIRKVLPAVCSTDSATETDVDKLCSRRK